MTIYEHITFSMVVKNRDAADPRFGTETELTFGGVRFVEADGESPKEVAVAHMAEKVINNDRVIAEFGRTWPIPRTFKLLRRVTPDDQGMRG